MKLLATIVIGRAAENSEVTYNAIRIPCETCQNSTMHDRIVKDRFTGMYRKARAKGVLIGWTGTKRTYRCRECGTKREF